MISKEKKQAIIKEYARTEGDTGSPEVQVAVLTARIEELTEHLKMHKNWNEIRGGIDNLITGYISDLLVILFHSNLLHSPVDGYKSFV